jgi:TfoX/Sxy family transcriptional regulator of competence genes
MLAVLRADPGSLRAFMKTGANGAGRLPRKAWAPSRSSAFVGTGSPTPRAPWVGDDPAVAYDEDLANRIRELIAGERDVTEQTMFGGLVFLVGGRMSVAVGGQGSLVVRVDPDEADVLLAKPHAHPFEMGGRELPGRLRIDAEGVRTKRQLEPWVRRSVAYARTLPSKQ